MQCWDPPEITRGGEDDYSGLLDRTRRNEAVRDDGASGVIMSVVWRVTPNILKLSYSGSF